jgi:hypothetical protein
MKRKQFSEEQIIGILKEAEAGAVVTELCRRHGMSSATYYAWKANYGGGCVRTPSEGRLRWCKRGWVQPCIAAISPGTLRRAIARLML